MLALGADLEILVDLSDIYLLFAALALHPKDFGFGDFLPQRGGDFEFIEPGHKSLTEFGGEN
jgi:hypothetical protein